MNFNQPLDLSSNLNLTQITFGLDDFNQPIRFKFKSESNSNYFWL
jgi:hypothetical protein